MIPNFLQRAKPSVFERYSGVAEVVVTLIITFASVSLAGIRIFKVRRKNRIGRFYSAVIEIRNSISASSTGDLNTLAQVLPEWVLRCGNGTVIPSALKRGFIVRCPGAVRDTHFRIDAG